MTELAVPTTAPAEAAAPPQAVEAAPAPSPAVEAAPAVVAPVEAAPAVETAKPSVQQPSLISEGLEKPAEPPKPEAAPVAETAPAEAPPAVTFEDFALPEGVKLDGSSVDQFKEVLGGNLSHQEKGQRLVDMYIAEIQRRDDEALKNQIDVWNTTQDQWKDSVKSDPEIGGNRFNTTMQTCISAVNRFGGNPEQRSALLQALDFTGAGNNPAIIRFINNMASALKEGTPVTQTAAPKPPQTRAQRRYNANGAN
jgi:hypothetical protein